MPTPACLAIAVSDVAADAPNAARATVMIRSRLLTASDLVDFAEVIAAPCLRTAELAKRRPLRYRRRHRGGPSVFILAQFGRNNGRPGTRHRWQRLHRRLVHRRTAATRLRRAHHRPQPR